MRFAIGLSLLLIANASAQIVPGSDSGNYAPDEEPRYFPRGVFGIGKSDNGDFRAAWYAQHLRALKEPTLLEKASANSDLVYRFTWVRSFDHPVTVRVVVHPNGTGTLTAKMANGEGGYKPGNLIANSTREIGAKEVRHLRNLVQVLDFWHMSPEPAPEFSLDGGQLVHLDGAQWILEASNGGDYHVVDRWSPSKGPLREIGLYMARTLGQLDIPGNSVY